MKSGQDQPQASFVIWLDVSLGALEGVFFKALVPEVDDHDASVTYIVTGCKLFKEQKDGCGSMGFQHGLRFGDL